MPTEPVAAVIYVFLLVPGLIYLFQSEKSRSAPRRSVFRETSTVVFASAVCLLTPLVLWALLASFIPALEPPLTDMLVGFSTTFAEDPVPHFLLVVVYLALASGLGFLFAHPKLQSLLSKLGAQSSFQKNRSAWSRVFEEMGDEAVVIASVQLKSGTWMQGQVSSYNAMVEDLDERALVLSGGLFIRTPTAEEPEALETGQQMVIQAADIEYLLVSYLAPQKEAEE